MSIDRVILTLKVGDATTFWRRVIAVRQNGLPRIAWIASNLGEEKKNIDQCVWLVIDVFQYQVD